MSNKSEKADKACLFVYNYMIYIFYTNGIQSYQQDVDYIYCFLYWW